MVLGITFAGVSRNSCGCPTIDNLDPLVTGAPLVCGCDGGGGPLLAASSGLSCIMACDGSFFGKSSRSGVIFLRRPRFLDGSLSPVVSDVDGGFTD